MPDFTVIELNGVGTAYYDPRSAVVHFLQADGDANGSLPALPGLPGSICV